MQIAYNARDLTEAHIIAGLLGAHGIDSHVGGHYLQGALGEIGAAGFTNVQVDDEDYLEARRLIAEYEGAATTDGRRIPSADDGSEFYARWFLLLMLAVAVGFVLVL
ncbi:putative signal transducing protein [Marinobacter sp. OP 3.4]|uniref:putative signal transducing protein n=1 Tax=Marinobacter sp. OP 3.4 TaxID=3076501 RepID=UPI002E1DFE53